MAIVPDCDLHGFAPLDLAMFQGVRRWCPRANKMSMNKAAVSCTIQGLLCRVCKLCCNPSLWLPWKQSACVTCFQQRNPGGVLFPLE